MATKPILTELNNGIITAVHAMPMKDLNSNNDSSFEIDRKLFNKSYYPIPLNNVIGRSIVQRRAPALRHGFVIDGPKSVLQKKWIGGNRDASQIVENRRKATTGQIMTFSGPQSFANKQDNNPRIDALARVRGGGARVPPKVAARPANYTQVSVPIINYLRIIAVGWNATDGTIVKSRNSSAYGISPGIYSYTNQNPTLIPLYIRPNQFVISYNVYTINRITGASTFNRYNLFGTNNEYANLVTQLNSLTSDVIVIIATYDEPQTVTQGNISRSPLPQSVVTAMQRCGASADFGSTSGTYGTAPTTYTGIINYRGAYVLVGIPGMGVGNGLQRYKGINNNFTGDPDAVVDIKISIINGNYTLV